MLNIFVEDKLLNFLLSLLNINLSMTEGKYIYIFF